MSKKDCQKKPRGTFDFRSDSSVVCVKWNDNCPVTVASNYCGVNPIQKVERRVKNEQKKIVDQPFLIKMYNQGMGGIDVCDKLLSSYRPDIKVECPRKRLGGRTAPPSKAVRFDGINHNLESVSQGRCALCKKNTRLCCVKCGKRLHRLCSKLYHKKK